MILPTMLNVCLFLIIKPIRAIIAQRTEDSDYDKEDTHTHDSHYYCMRFVIRRRRKLQQATTF